MAYIDTLESQRADRRFVKASVRAPLLSREREFELARLWRYEEDEDALHELITAYTRLVISTAGKYRNYGLPVADLIQEGCIGLMQAAARFEPEREIRFSTYASWWIRSAMQDYILRNWSIVRTGTTAAQKSLFFNFRRLRAKIDSGNIGPLGPEARHQIANQLGVKLGEVELMEGRLSGSDQSLNSPVGESGDEEWQDFIADARSLPEEMVFSVKDSETRAAWIGEALEDLSARERTIINERRLRDEAVTLEALGKELGISKERVRQIEHKALQKLKSALDRRVEDYGDLLFEG